MTSRARRLVQKTWARRALLGIYLVTLAGTVLGLALNLADLGVPCGLLCVTSGGILYATQEEK